MQNSVNNNLNIISQKNPSLYEKLNSFKGYSSKFNFVYNENSEVILTKDRILMNDPVNPIHEALSLYNTLTRNNEDDTCFLIGFDLGYLFTYLSNNYTGSIIVFEPCLETLKLAFDTADYSQALAKDNVYIANDEQELNQAITSAFKKGAQAHVIANSYYSLKYAQLIENLKPQLSQLWLEPYKGGPLKLNIGAGNWAVKGWRTLDCYRNADFFVDLRKLEKLDIEDNCIEKAFSSHCFEHITDENIQNLFNELYRTLKPGGIFRFSCPDADKALEAYKNKDYEWFSWVKQNDIGKMLLNTFVSYEYNSGGPEVDEEIIKDKFENLNKDDFIKWCVGLKDDSRPYIAHQNGLYFEKLKIMLEKAGFKNIVKSSYRQSSDEELRDEAFDNYPSISIYVECIK